MKPGERNLLASIHNAERPRRLTQTREPVSMISITLFVALVGLMLVALLGPLT